MTTDNEMDRRTVLKATGATVLGGVAVTGTASACQPDEGYEGPDQVVFCGCSQVCWCIDLDDCGSVTVVTRSGNVGPFTDETDCYEGDGIQAIECNGTRYWNPNTDCAKTDPPSDAQYGERGGPCGKPPCEHPGRGNGRGGRRGGR